MVMRPRTTTPATRRGDSLRPVYEDFKPVSEWTLDAQGSDTLLIRLPGFVKERLRVALENTGTLRVNGQRELGNNRWSRFSQEYRVPENCDTNGIRAKFENAILAITLPKKKVPQSAPPKDLQTNTTSTSPPPPQQLPQSPPKPTISVPQQQLQPPPQQPQPSTPKPSISSPPQPSVQPLPGIRKPTIDDESKPQKVPDNTSAKASLPPPITQPSISKPTISLPTPPPTQQPLASPSKPTVDEDLSTEGDLESTSPKATTRSPKKSLESAVLIPTLDEKHSVEDNESDEEAESPTEIKNQKKMDELRTKRANEQMTESRKADVGREKVLEKQKESGEKSNDVDKERDTTHLDDKKVMKHEHLAGSGESDGLEFGNYMKHVKSKLSEERQALVNAGVAVLIIFALGTYLSYTVGPSGKN